DALPIFTSFFSLTSDIWGTIRSSGGIETQMSDPHRSAHALPTRERPMSPSSSPRPVLSAENTDRLSEALLLSDELQSAAPAGDEKLVELRALIERCRDGIRRQNPHHRPERLTALDQARNYLRFLPDMQSSQATGRLRSVSRRLRVARRA